MTFLPASPRSRVMIVLPILVLFIGLSNSLQAAAPAQQKTDLMWQRFEDKVAETAKNLDGVLGVALLDLTSGRKFLLHGDEIFPQASSIKIAILAELYHQAEQAANGAADKQTLSAPYIVQASDIVQDSDIMGGLTPGVTTLTNRDLATMMVAVSDNAATNVLIERVGMGNVKALMDRLGLKETKLRRKMMDLTAAAEGRENVSTPREMMILLETLYRGKLLGPQMTDDFFTMLATHKDSWIPVNLPETLKIANKPGALEGVRNDSGVIFLKDRPFILCVNTTFLGSERAGEQAISAISGAAYELFDRLSRASDYGRVISVSNGSVH